MADKPSKSAVDAWARLIRVSQDLLARVEADLKTDFPPLSWYDALLELQRAGDEGLRPYQLQERMLLAQYNLSRLVDRLAKSGYVARMPAAEDGRGQVLTITAAGKSLLRRMWPAYRAAIKDRFADRLDSSDIAALGRIIGKLEQ